MKDKEKIEEIVKLEILDCADIKLAYLDDMRISKSKPLSLMHNIFTIDCKKDYILEALGIPKNSVVLSKEEYEKVAQSFAKELLLQTERTTKEVVEKFISEIEFHGIATMDGLGLEYFKISSLGLREIAREQFDVEVDI